jgi:uncharacterized membrane protein YbjE (DUF340 family)
MQRQNGFTNTILLKVINLPIKIKRGLWDLAFKISRESDNNNHNENKTKIEIKNICENIDLVLITFLAIIALIVGAVFSIISFISGNICHIDGSNSDFSTLFYSFNIVIIFITNAAFALMPSLLSSMFPQKFRTTASSIRHNGGLALGFAAPFISMSTLIHSNQPTLLFMTAVVGAILIIIGGTKLIKRNIPRLTVANDACQE